MALQGTGEIIEVADNRARSLAEIETMATMALMAEPSPATDDTTVVGGDETVGVPSSAATDAVNLAWSRNDNHAIQTDIQPESTAVGQSWRATWGKAGALLTAGLVIAAAIVVGRWAFSTAPSPHQVTGPPPAASSTPKAATTPGPAVPTTASPPAIESTPDQDTRYVQALNDRGISFANPEGAIYNGKMVCGDIQRGVPVQQIADAFRASNPALTDSANAYVAISVHAYCPQNDKLVAGF